MIHWRTWLLWAGLLLALGVANRGIFGHERTLAEGRVLLLELAPVDPRSLMQGDYMALRFAAAVDIRGELDPACRTSPGGPGGNAAALKCLGFGMDTRDRPRADGYAVFALDKDGVGRFLRIQDAPTPVARGEVAVRFRERGWNGIHIASNAWFFPEGQGERYQPARYGELRVAKDGTALLTGLRDAQRKRL